MKFSIHSRTVRLGNRTYRGMKLFIHSRTVRLGNRTYRGMKLFIHSRTVRLGNRTYRGMKLFIHSRTVRLGNRTYRGMEGIRKSIMEVSNLTIVIGPISNYTLQIAILDSIEARSNPSMLLLRPTR